MTTLCDLVKVGGSSDGEDWPGHRRIAYRHVAPGGWLSVMGGEFGQGGRG